MAEPHVGDAEFSWDGPRNDDRIAVMHAPDGSLSVAVQMGGEIAAVVMPRRAARSLRDFLNANGVGDAPDDLDAQVDAARKGYGEFINAGSTHLCPACHEPTTYRLFSGGRSWICENCDTDGEYPDGQAPSRAGLLATPEGRAALRDQVRAHVDQSRGGGDAAPDA